MHKKLLATRSVLSGPGALGPRLGPWARTDQTKMILARNLQTELVEAPTLPPEAERPGGAAEGGPSKVAHYRLDVNAGVTGRKFLLEKRGSDRFSRTRRLLDSGHRRRQTVTGPIFEKGLVLCSTWVGLWGEDVDKDWCIEALPSPWESQSQVVLIKCHVVPWFPSSRPDPGHVSKSLF